MTWTDFYQRRDAINAVLEYAHQNPSETLTPHCVPEAQAIFSDTTELLSALQYKWMQALTAQIALALDEADEHPQGDRLQAVTDAWRRAAEGNPLLRAVLDRHTATAAGTLKRSFEHEQRMLAHTAGLTEIGEGPAEAVRVGSAFLHLLRSPAAHSAERPSALRRLRNLLPIT